MKMECRQKHMFHVFHSVTKKLSENSNVDAQSLLDMN